MAHAAPRAAAALLLALVALGCGGAARSTQERTAQTASGPASQRTASEGQPSAPAAMPFRMPCGESDLVACTNGCAEKQVEDCVTLASMYMRGEVVSVDQDRAIALFRDGCSQGSARGCMRLGDVYHSGVLHDEAEEAASYRKACEAGANLGCVAAGKAYLDGKGVDADPKFAAALFGRVCDRGNASGCFELGRLYEQGEGVKADKDRAFQLFSKACQLGLDEGCLVASRTTEVLPPRN